MYHAQLVYLNRAYSVALVSETSLQANFYSVKINYNLNVILSIVGGRPNAVHTGCILNIR